MDGETKNTLTGWIAYNYPMVVTFIIPSWLATITASPFGTKTHDVTPVSP